MARILLIGLYKLGRLALEALLSREMDVVGAVTKPEPLLDEEPLVRLARSRGIPVLIPPEPRDAAFLKRVSRLRPDLIVVAGYHRLLPRKLLSIPPRGVLNLHGSLLPRHRGPVPWKWSILAGETVTGMTVQVMGARLDEGPILAQEPCPILPDDTGGVLVDRLCVLGGPLLARTAEAYLTGHVTPRPQDERLATYEGYPSDEDAQIQWDWDAERIRNLVRGLSPKPGAWTTCRGIKLRVRSAEHADAGAGAVPGMILGHSERSVRVSTGRGALVLGAVSLDGESIALDPQRREELGMTPGACLGTGAPEASLPIL